MKGVDKGWESWDVHLAAFNVVKGPRSRSLLICSSDVYFLCM